MRKLVCRAIAVTAAITVATTVGAQTIDGPGDARAGREFAVETCSECHMVTARRLTQRRADAPPDFVEIANTPGLTERSIYVFLHTSHPTMPNLILSDRESANVIAYILGLKKPDKQ